MELLDFDVLPEDHVRKLGLIVLQSDVTIEDEFRFYFEGAPVSLLVNRIPFENTVTVETLRQMKSHLAVSMSLFPIDAHFDCLGYGCTSGALHIGGGEISSLVKDVRSCGSVTNPMLAAITAMNYISVSRMAYLAPYSEAVSQSMVDKFEEQGIHVCAAATFDEKQDKIVGRISPSSIKKECIQLARNYNVDVVFVSCTNMKCADIIPDVEEQTGVVVISSNQALAWHMSQLATLDHDKSGKGRLFEW